PALDIQRAERPPQHLGAARRWKDKLHQQLERRGLPGPVRTEKAKHFAGCDLQRQPIERAVRARAPEPGRRVLGAIQGGAPRSAMSPLTSSSVKAYFASKSVTWPTSCAACRTTGGVNEGWLLNSHSSIASIRLRACASRTATAASQADGCGPPPVTLTLHSES